MRTGSKTLLKLAALSGAVLCLFARAAGRAAESADPGQASAGDFNVMQIATVDPQKFMRSWGAGGDSVQVERANTMKRNQAIATFILFSGCRADADGNCNVTADFDASSPSGAPYAHIEGVKVWVGRPAPPPKSIGLSEDGFGLRIEDKDAVGAYTVRATVFDHNSGVKLQTRELLLAVD